jgi:hypothetical protein
MFSSGNAFTNAVLVVQLLPVVPTIACLSHEPTKSVSDVLTLTSVHVDAPATAGATQRATAGGTKG